MAFHLHLINSLWDFVPAAAPQIEQNRSSKASVASRPSLRWYVGDDGRPQARWTQDCDCKADDHPDHPPRLPGTVGHFPFAANLVSGRAAKFVALHAIAVGV